MKIFVYTPETLKYISSDIFINNCKHTSIPIPSDWSGESRPIGYCWDLLATQNLDTWDHFTSTYYTSSIKLVDVHPSIHPSVVSSNFCSVPTKDCSACWLWCDVFVCNVFELLLLTWLLVFHVLYVDGVYILSGYILWDWVATMH